MSKQIEIISDIDEDFENDGLDNDCPNCGREYDEIDREYQICHLCGFNNNKNDNYDG